MSSVPYRTYACPSCGYARCGNCQMMQVQLPGAFERRKYSTPSRNCYKGLPIIFHVGGQSKEIVTTDDSGTVEDHNSLKVAQSMGYEIYFYAHDRPELILANGTTTRALARVTAKIRFGRIVTGVHNDEITCIFNVFETLALPANMGLAFLKATETLEKHTSRLIDLTSALPATLHVFTMGGATNQVSCTVDGNKIVAHADTGSHIALINGEYALKHGLLRKYGCEKLMLADGSIEYTSGFADIEVKVVSKPGKQGTSGSQKVRFHVLKNLQFNVILDEQLVSDFRLFDGTTTSLVARASQALPCLAPIIRLGRIEDSALTASEKTSGKIKEWTKELLSSEEEQKPTINVPSKYGLSVSVIFSDSSEIQDRVGAP